MDNLLSSVVLLPFESLINLCIAQDKRLIQELKKHTGKVLEIHILSAAVLVFVHFSPSSIRLSLVDNRRTQSSLANARIAGTASTLLQAMTKPSPAGVSPEIQISGDVEFVQEIYQLFSEMEIDWQSPLSNLFGDVPVHGLESLLSNFFTFGKKVVGGVAQNLEEYLQEEIRLVPGKNEIEIFDQNLATLRFEIDRLGLRQKNLQELVRKIETAGIRRDI